MKLNGTSMLDMNDPILRELRYVPEYLQKFLASSTFIMSGTGPLPYHYRHYIAIMAVARYRCVHLLEAQKREFLAAGGDKNWLCGIEHIPKKLRGLSEINKILAHRPWLMTHAHIQRLTHSSETWTLGEVVHAVVILSHFHSLCSVTVSQHRKHLNSINHASHSLNDIKEQHPLEETLYSGCLSAPSAVFHSEDSLLFRLRPLLDLRDKNGASNEEVSRFIDDASFSYQDFCRRGKENEAPSFRVQDYSWEDHGYSLINRLYGDVGIPLDDKLKEAHHSIYRLQSKPSEDTEPYITAICNYVQCLYGIRHDDYDYGQVNKLLDRDLKTYIKTTTCYPERLKSVPELSNLNHSQKVELSILILEAKQHVELLYALRAITTYLT